MTLKIRKKRKFHVNNLHDHIAGSSLKLTKVSCFFKLTADEVLVFDWIAGSIQVNSPKHKRGFIFRALYINYSSYTVNAFCVQVENALEDVFFLHFSLVSIQFDIS